MHVNNASKAAGKMRMCRLDPQPRRRHFSGWRGSNLAGAPTKIRLAAAPNFSGGGRRRNSAPVRKFARIAY